eukprot:2010472-Lingulodinium_polyedra.AAC.1
MLPHIARVFEWRGSCARAGHGTRLPLQFLPEGKTAHRRATLPTQKLNLGRGSERHAEQQLRHICTA